jgi:hypothetical protein
LALSLSFLLVSCNTASHNVDQKGGNVSVKELKTAREDNTINSALEDLPSNENENIEDLATTEDINFDQWRELLVDMGEFDSDFVDELKEEDLKKYVKSAEKLAEKTGYRDVKDFVFQEIAEDYPEKSEKFPLDSIAAIYERKAVANDEGTDKYQDERSLMVEKGMDEDTAYSYTNEEIKKAFTKAYKDNIKGYYDDYVTSAMEILEKEEGDNQASNALENSQGNSQDYYDNLRQDLIDHYEFDPDVVERITNQDIDVANYRAQKRLQETGYGDIGLVYEELGKMFPGASTMYPGE